MTVTAAPELVSVANVAHQPVSGAAQNILLGAYCWIAVARDDHP